MRRLMTIALLLVSSRAGAQGPSLTVQLETALGKFPARAGVYVKNLRTGEEAAVHADDAFNTFSVIKLAILVKAFHMADEKQ